MGVAPSLADERERQEDLYKERVCNSVLLHMDSLRSSLHGFAIVFEKVLKTGDSSKRLERMFAKKDQGNVKSQLRTLRVEVSKMAAAGKKYLQDAQRGEVQRIEDATRGLVAGGNEFFRATFPPLMRQYDPTVFCPVAVATAATLIEDLGLDRFQANLAKWAVDGVVYDDFSALLRKPQLTQDELFKFKSWWHKLQLAQDLCEGFIPGFLGAMNYLRWLKDVHASWNRCITLKFVAEVEMKVPPTDTTTTPDPEEPPVGASSQFRPGTYYGAA